MTAKQSPGREIAATVYEELKAQGCEMAKGLFPAVAKRVDDILKEVKDRDQVELICLFLAQRDGDEFSSWRSLGWGTYEYIRDQMGVPPGFWRWELWAWKEKDDKYRLSVDYWVAMARDSHGAGDRGGMEHAAEMLERLWAHKVAEGVTWSS